MARGTPDIVEPVESPLGEAFEQALEEAKQASALRQPRPQNDDPFLAQLSPNLSPRNSGKKPELDR